MDFSLLYSIVFCGLLSLLPLWVILTTFYRTVEPRFRSSAARFVYTRLPALSQPTWLEISLGVIFLGVNVGVLVHLGVQDLSLLKVGSAKVSTVNFILLFLGRRTNPLADYLNVPLRTYYFAHRVVGLVAIAAAFLHSGLVLHHGRIWDPASKSGTLVSHPWNLCRALLTCLKAVGGLLGILMFCAFLMLFPVQSRCTGPSPARVGHLRLGLARFSGRLHLLLAMSTLIGMLWHVMLQNSLIARIPVFVACGVWCSTQLYCFGRVFLLSQAHAQVTQTWNDDDIVRLRLQTNHGIDVFPGCYFYVFFRGKWPFYNLLQGYPLMLCWCEPEQLVKGQATTLTFLMRKSQQHNQSLSIASNGQGVRLDGPYGIDWHIYNFETVILAARGMGIVGILPYALHLAARRRHDESLRKRSNRLRNSNEPVFGDLSRCVDVIWWLEHEEQEAWVREQLRDLQELDAKVSASVRPLVLI